jgi:hypothetical protein
MKTVIRRIGRLENQLQLAGNPRDRFRLVMGRLDRKPGFENATCRRTLWPNGTVFEMVWLNRHHDRPGEPTAEELDRWVESFPVEAQPGQPRTGPDWGERR